MKKNILLLMTLLIGSVYGQEISGTYYVGEPNYDASLEHPWKRTFSSVDITYDPSNYTIELVYDKNQRPMKGGPSQNAMEAVKSGEQYSFAMNNVGASCLTNTTLLQIEPGVFVVDPATNTNLGCENPKRATKSAAPSKGGKVYPVESLVREFILGKDQARIKQLCENKEEYEKLVEIAVIKKCKGVSASVAGNNPIPNEGMTDAATKKEIHNLISNFATSKNWPQKVHKTFIQSNDWETLKTGNVITGRQLTCVVVTNGNGNCRWSQFYIRQDYNKGTYGKSYAYGEGRGSYPTSCN